MVGDGTYLMMNSDIYSSVLSGHKMILIVCDNGGFAVINRLQNGKGMPWFNNQIVDCKVKERRFRASTSRCTRSRWARCAACRQSRRSRAAMDWAKTTTAPR